MEYPNPKKLSNKDLLALTLKPIEVNMPNELKEYLKKVEKEFYRRDIKLRWIISAK